mmetsp:Transcript_23622/g.84298  ORF Transcript_23622/g.84298 Transcript_23622/m.84298 type:complete len:227 (-) Transcript_23622:121-801(-)
MPSTAVVAEETELLRAEEGDEERRGDDRGGRGAQRRGAAAAARGGGRRGRGRLKSSGHGCLGDVQGDLEVLDGPRAPGRRRRLVQRPFRGRVARPGPLQEEAAARVDARGRPLLVLILTLVFGAPGEFVARPCLPRLFRSVCVVAGEAHFGVARQTEHCAAASQRQKLDRGRGLVDGTLEEPLIWRLDHGPAFKCSRVDEPRGHDDSRRYGVQVDVDVVARLRPCT